MVCCFRVVSLTFNLGTPLSKSACHLCVISFPFWFQKLMSSQSICHFNVGGKPIDSRNISQSIWLTACPKLYEIKITLIFNYLSFKPFFYKKKSYFMKTCKIWFKSFSVNLRISYLWKHMKKKRFFQQNHKKLGWTFKCFDRASI